MFEEIYHLTSCLLMRGHQGSLVKKKFDSPV